MKQSNLICPFIRFSLPGAPGSRGGGGPAPGGGGGGAGAAIPGTGGGGGGAGADPENINEYIIPM